MLHYFLMTIDCQDTGWCKYSTSDIFRAVKRICCIHQKLLHNFALLPNIGNFARKLNDMKTTSVALGSYFENFIASTIQTGRYNNASEVIRAGLRMLEENEQKISELKAAVEEGENSGRYEDFDSESYLKTIKASHKNG